MTDKTTIEVTDSTREALRDERHPRESNYNETIARLLGNESGGQLWTEREIRVVVRDEIERQVRR